MSNNSVSNAPASNTVKGSQPVNLSVGSGIAISAIWICATGLTIFAVLFLFSDAIVGNTHAFGEGYEDAKRKGEVLIYITFYLGALFFFFVITIQPVRLACLLTRRFFGKDE